MENFKIEKADFSQINKSRIVEMYLKEPDKYTDYINRVSEDKYLYWDKIKYLSIPTGLTPVEFWYMVKLARNISSKNTSIKAEHELLRYLIEKGEKSYITPSSFIELNKISRETATKDLRSLDNLNLIEKKRAGKNMRYSSTEILRKELHR